jgi:hypothetical protein
MATFVPNPAAIANLMTNPAGPVQRDLLRRGEAVLSLARSLLARSDDSGDLSASLRVIQTGAGVAVGSDLPQCVYLHEGTGPSHITGDGGLGSVSDPRAPYFPPWKDVRFAGWAEGHGWNSSINFARHVFTHGTAPNPFLREAMVAART